jgi:hypothetical protein
MMEIKIGKRLVIVTAEYICDDVIAMITELGAGGYTVVPITKGRGKRGVRAGVGFSGRLLRNVRIEIITKEEIAEKIGAAMVERFAEHHPCLVYMGDVQVIHCNEMGEIK